MHMAASWKIVLQLVRVQVVLKQLCQRFGYDHQQFGNEICTTPAKLREGYRLRIHDSDDLGSVPCKES